MSEMNRIHQKKETYRNQQNRKECKLTEQREMERNGIERFKQKRYRNIQLEKGHKCPDRKGIQNSKQNMDKVNWNLKK